jgi:hypothetical protein
MKYGPRRARRTVAALEADGRILPESWPDWRFGRDGLFYHPQWRRGFEPAELSAMWFTTQQVRALKARVRQLAADLERADAERDAAERRAYFYRRQLVLESQLGLCLARITEQGEQK